MSAQHIVKHILDTLAHVTNSQQVALISVENSSSGKIIGYLNKGKFLASDKRIEFKNTPLQDIVINKKVACYPGIAINSIPFPIYERKNNNFFCTCAPLIGESQQVTGIATLAQNSETSTAQHCIVSLSRLIGSTMETLLEHERLYQMATIDSLTGLFTLHHFESRLQEEFTRIRRHGGIMSLLLLDVDHFKQINELCGYEEGNNVLKDIGVLINQSVRKEIDVPCRYRGEQFAILLPHTNIDGAYTLAERIRQRCIKHLFTTSRGIPIKVTISLGVSHSLDVSLDENSTSDSYRKSGKTNSISKHELLYRADLMLDAAKQAGRNRVMVWW